MIRKLKTENNNYLDMEWIGTTKHNLDVFIRIYKQN